MKQLLFTPAGDASVRRLLGNSGATVQAQTWPGEAILGHCRSSSSITKPGLFTCHRGSAPACISNHAVETTPTHWLGTNLKDCHGSPVPGTAVGDSRSDAIWLPSGDGDWGCAGPTRMTRVKGLAISSSGVSEVDSRADSPTYYNLQAHHPLGARTAPAPARPATRARSMRHGHTAQQGGFACS